MVELVFFLLFVLIVFIFRKNTNQILNDHGKNKSNRNIFPTSAPSLDVERSKKISNAIKMGDLNALEELLSPEENSVWAERISYSGQLQIEIYCHDRLFNKKIADKKLTYLANIDNNFETNLAEWQNYLKQNLHDLLFKHAILYYEKEVENYTKKFHGAELLFMITEAKIDLVDTYADRYIQDHDIAISSIKFDVDTHIQTLKLKRNQLIKIDDYGVEDYNDWHKELQYFLDKVVVIYPEYYSASEIESFIFETDKMILTFPENEIDNSMKKVSDGLV